jgi:peptidoglycan/LPS O-acetylase OafA/YrhL
VVFAILLTLLVAYATYQLIEVLSRAWLRRRLRDVIAAGFGDGKDPNIERLRSPGASQLEPVT